MRPTVYHVGEFFSTQLQETVTSFAIFYVV